MPKKRLGTKSKRVTCHKRYKILRKIREHHRKERKEAKKNVNRFKRKDPGIPNSIPFKEEILKHATEISVKDKETRLHNLKSRPSETKFDEPKLNLSNFRKEGEQVINEADVILEVLDARDPLGTRCFLSEEKVKDARKRLVLILNKSDLVPSVNLQKWVMYLRKSNTVIPFKASTQQQPKHLSHGKLPLLNDTNDRKKRPSKGSGVDELLSLLANYSRNGTPGCKSKGTRRCLVVGVVGLPNTGKSCLINTLKRRKVCASGNTPGVTRHCQRVRLDKDLYMIDSPGVLASKSIDPYDLVLKNCLKPESLPDPVPAVDAILRRCSKEQMMRKYDIDDYEDSTSFLVQLARRLGRMKKGGALDMTAAARAIIHDWIIGKITYFTEPPNLDDEMDEQCVATPDPSENDSLSEDVLM